MPVRETVLKQQTLSLYKQHSYEYLTLAWLLSDAWEASQPSLDIHTKTDIQVLDGRKVYRIQIKSLETVEENISIKNMWENADIDFVIYFSRNANWGYIVPAFKEKSRKLNAHNHILFKQDQLSFLSAFSRC